jgi:hypothetical protein
MRQPPSSGESHQRGPELGNALTTSAPLRLGPDGIALFAAAATESPQPPDELVADQRRQYEILVKTGLLQPDGRVAERARDAALALRSPNVILQIKAVREQVPMMWTAWIGEVRAFIAASINSHTRNTAPASDHELNVEIVVPGWATISALRWLGVTPRPQAAPYTKDLQVGRVELERRLAGDQPPVPEDASPALRAVWQEANLLWSASSTPGDTSMVILDAGRAGIWLLRYEGELTLLSPRSSHEVWRDLMRLVIEADRSQR